MRTLLIAAILAGVSAPALSEPLEPEDPPGKPRFERGDRPERPERAERTERQQADTPRPQRTFERRRDADSGNASPAVERPSPLTRERAMAAPQFESPPEPARRRAAGDTVREWRMGERRRDDSPSSIEERNLREAPTLGSGGGGLVQPSRPLPRVFDPQKRRVSRTPSFGTEPQAPSIAGTRHAEPATRWSTQWRRDHRYDWRDWRRRHRSRFHLGFYFDPFGWGYHRYSIGWRLWPHYYHRSYWLSDPWHYRLPPAYGPYRWIRYHDDALLVNLYTGEVVDVIYDFFW